MLSTSSRVTLNVSSSGAQHGSGLPIADREIAVVAEEPPHPPDLVAVIDAELVPPMGANIVARGLLTHGAYATLLLEQSIEFSEADPVTSAEASIAT